MSATQSEFPLLTFLVPVAGGSASGVWTIRFTVSPPAMDPAILRAVGLPTTAGDRFELTVAFEAPASTAAPSSARLSERLKAIALGPSATSKVVYVLAIVGTDEKPQATLWKRVAGDVEDEEPASSWEVLQTE